MALAAVVAIAVVVLARWLFGDAAAGGSAPEGSRMKANVAIGFLLAVASLVLVARRGTASAVLGGVTALIGALTLLQYLSGSNLGLDELAIRDHSHAFNQSPGRMAPFTAWAFVVLGLGLALVRVRRAQGWVKACALQIAAFGLICVSGHLWGAVESTNRLWTPPVSLGTATGFLLIAFALWRKVSRRTGRPPSLAVGTRRRPVFVATLAIVIVAISAGFAYRSIAQFATGQTIDPIKMLVSLMVTFGFSLLALIWLAVTIRAEVRRNAMMARKVSRANAKLEVRVQKRTAELHRYSDRLQSMAHSLAHDLRQPLITAGCHAELLGSKLKAGGTSDLVVHYEKIDLALRDIDRINDQILRFAATGDAQAAPAARALSPSAAAP
jgi:uncharacterized membrane protein YciS (DUF1049 family)